MAGMAAGALAPLGPRPDDDRRRRWFLQDFEATSLADERLELRTAAESIERMERALRSRHGTYQCWESPAQDHFEASVPCKTHSGSSEPEFSDGASQPDDAGRAEPMDDSEQEPAHEARQPGAPASEPATSEWDRMHRMESSDPGTEDGTPEMSEQMWPGFAQRASGSSYLSCTPGPRALYERTSASLPTTQHGCPT